MNVWHICIVNHLWKGWADFILSTNSWTFELWTLNSELGGDLHKNKCWQGANMCTAHRGSAGVIWSPTACACAWGLLCEWTWLEPYSDLSQISTSGCVKSKLHTSMIFVQLCDRSTVSQRWGASTYIYLSTHLQSICAESWSLSWEILWVRDAVPQRSHSVKSNIYLAESRQSVAQEQKNVFLLLDFIYCVQV